MGGKKRKVASTDLDLARSIDLDPPRKNPRRAARVLSDSYFNTTVIKCTFNPLAKFPVVANEVRGCVETLAVVFYHTHLAMLLLLSRNKGRLVLKGETINDNRDAEHVERHGTCDVPLSARARSTWDRQHPHVPALSRVLR